MQSNFVFLVDKVNKVITVKRSYEAPLELVWDAYTKSEILDQWWAPKPWQSKTKSMDFTEGGSWHYAMVGPNGEAHWAVATFSKIITLQSYTGTDSFTDEFGNINKELPQSHWDVNFAKESIGTTVTFLIHYSDLQQLETTLEMGFQEGFTATLTYLEGLLAAQLKSGS